MAYSALPNCQLAKVFLNIAGPAAVEENYCQRSSFCFQIKKLSPGMELSWLSPPLVLGGGSQSGKVPRRKWPRTRSLALGYTQGCSGLSSGECFPGLWAWRQGPPPPAQQLCTLSWHSQGNKEEREILRKHWKYKWPFFSSFAPLYSINKIWFFTERT